MSAANRKRSHGSMDSMEPNAKRSRLHLEKVPCQLMSLPREVLERIFSMVAFPLRLVRISDSLRVLYTDYMMHRHRCFVHSYRQQPQEGFRETVVRAVLKVLSVATEYFVRCGYESHFANNLAALHVVISESFNMNALNFRLIGFVRHFLRSLERPLGSLKTGSGPAGATKQVQHRRLLLTMSLLNLLKQFRFYRVISSHMKVLHWHLDVEVQGIFLIVLDQLPDNPRLQSLNQIIDIIGLITEMLLYDQLNGDFVCIKTIGRFSYKYGLDLDNKPKNRLVLRFRILAPKSIILLLQKAIAGEIELTDSLHMPPNSPFSVRLEMSGKLRESRNEKIIVLQLAKLY